MNKMHGMTHDTFSGETPDEPIQRPPDTIYREYDRVEFKTLEVGQKCFFYAHDDGIRGNVLGTVVTKNEDGSGDCEYLGNIYHLKADDEVGIGATKTTIKFSPWETPPKA